MSLVHKDEMGIYIITGGYTFRPGNIDGYDHAYNMSGDGVLVGSKIKARHIAGTPLCRITLTKTDKRIWGNNYIHGIK